MNVYINCHPQYVHMYVGNRFTYRDEPRVYIPRGQLVPTIKVNINVAIVKLILAILS
jgi:hypothetical protein